MWYRLLISPFSPLSLIPIIYYRETIKFFRENIYLFIFIIIYYLSTFFANDEERLIAPIFPIIYLIIAKIPRASFLKVLAK